MAALRLILLAYLGDAPPVTELIKLGVFFVPIATKQCSISAAHTADDIDQTLAQFDRALTIHCDR